MKKTLVLLLLIFGFKAKSQNMFITSALATTVTGGVNINLKTVTGNGAGYLSNSYTISGNEIALDVCYWFDNTLPILNFENNFFIPLSLPGTYTITIKIILSSSTTVCNNFSIPDTETIQYDFLSNPNFTFNNPLKLFPNPSSGMVYFERLDSEIKQIQITDISGKIIKEIVNLSEKFLDLSHLQEGLYFITIQTDKGILNKKIVIKK